MKKFICIPLLFRGVSEASSPSETIFPRLINRNAKSLSTVYRKVRKKCFSRQLMRVCNCVTTSKKKHCTTCSILYNCLSLFFSPFCPSHFPPSLPPSFLPPSLLLPSLSPSPSLSSLSLSPYLRLSPCLVVSISHQSSFKSGLSLGQWTWMILLIVIARLFRIGKRTSEPSRQEGGMQKNCQSQSLT